MENKIEVIYNRENGDLKFAMAIRTVHSENVIPYLHNQVWG